MIGGEHLLAPAAFRAAQATRGSDALHGSERDGPATRALATQEVHLLDE